jgi:hypothetical protein
MRIELTVERGRLGEILGALREWIDRKKADAVHFRSATGSNGIIVVRLEFAHEELGHAFREDWTQAGFNVDLIVPTSR